MFVEVGAKLEGKFICREREAGPDDLRRHLPARLVVLEGESLPEERQIHFGRGRVEDYKTGSNPGTEIMKGGR